MRESLEKHWQKICNVVAQEISKEDILKSIHESLIEIDVDMGWVDERRKIAEESYSALLKEMDEIVKEENNEDANDFENNFYIYSNYPLIFSKDEFLTREECKHIIEISQPYLKEATVYNEKTQKDEISDYRKCKVCYFKHTHDDVITEIVERISNVVQVSPVRAELLQVISYEEGEYFDYHVDAFSLNDINMQDGGQRLFTTMVYLNDVEEGGETHFKLLNITVEPKEGRLLVFQNCLKNSNAQNTQTLHAGLPIKKGKKYAINLWYRENVHSQKNIEEYVRTI